MKMLQSYKYRFNQQLKFFQFGRCFSIDNVFSCMKLWRVFSIKLYSNSNVGKIQLQHLILENYDKNIQISVKFQKESTSLTQTIVNFIHKSNEITSYMSRLSIIISIILMCFVIQLIECSQSRKCQSNQNMKYELNHTHELKGYHSICSEFAKRTCCSGKNFDSLAKKITSKLIVPGSQSHNLSTMCRRKMTNLLCSTCDGDIGQKAVQGVCPSVCHNVYEACKDDLFSIDSLGKIKVCRDDDIICSKLSDIIPSSSQADSLCEMFGIEVAQHDCWNGFPSSQTKGAAKRKTNYHQRPKKSKKQHEPTIIDALRRVDCKYWVYVGLVSFLLAILAYKWLSIKLQNEAKKIKNQ